MKQSHFNYFKSKLISENEETRKIYQSFGFGFLDLTTRQAKNLCEALIKSGFYKYDEKQVYLDNGIVLYR